MFFAFLLTASIICYAFYRWATANYEFFEKRGVPFDKPFPLLGSFKDGVLKKKSMFQLINELYAKSNGKFYGIFDFRQPLLLLRDPELIKQVTIKDFDHFINHRPMFDECEHNLFGNSLVFLQNDKWRHMRSTLTPAFTGSKMRQMFDLMNQVARDAALHLKELEKNSNALELDVKDYMTRYANDIIATTAFGLQVNSFKQQNNEFYAMGKQLTQFTAWQLLKFFLYANFRAVMKLFDLEIVDKKNTRYFKRLVLDAMKHRKANNITRPDLINVLMEQKPHSRAWTDVDVVAQCLFFFFAGFESVSTSLCFAAHELMANPAVQLRLHAEVEAVLQALGGRPLDYESLQRMQYLDMVVSETLRKWPSTIAVDRVANKDFGYTSSDGERLEVRQGDFLWLPICAIQRDAKYFPHPDKFDPERFSEENKHKIVPFTYLAFGAGPRGCIGARFASLEVKALLFYLIKEFRIEACQKTCIPIELEPSGFRLSAKNGFWLKFLARSQ